jgi:hypothetical protein
LIKLAECDAIAPIWHALAPMIVSEVGLTTSGSVSALAGFIFLRHRLRPRMRDDGAFLRESFDVLGFPRNNLAE